MSADICASLMKFLDKSPTMFHACANVARRLNGLGYAELRESGVWETEPGGAYYVVRGDSSVIAFRLPKARPRGFMLAAAHSDSPGYRVRQTAEVPSAGETVRLAVEMYGGAIARSWLDRPLSVAGRVFCRDGEKIFSRLVNVDRDLLVIPSVPIHLAAKFDTGGELKPNVDMLPLFSRRGGGDDFYGLLRESAGIERGELVSTDLFLYPRARASRVGARGEFLASPRIDDLECAWCLLEGFVSARASGSMPVYCLFDSEEVGSGTWQGAASTFLEDTLDRIGEALGMNVGERLTALANSFMVSADNAHAVHPAHPEYYDENERPRLNGGVVIKFSAARRYATDGLSSALFARVCERAGVPVQLYGNRADLPGGSTLGRVLVPRFSVPCVDIGLAQLAMHSCYEIAGARDPELMRAAMREYYSLSPRREENGAYALET